ncbi:hypothetical protein Tco_1563856 [Tanacetum coccineum]
MPQRMARLEEDVYEIRRALTEQREVIDAMARDFFQNKTGSKFSTIVLKKYHDGHINAEEKEVVELDDDTT